MRFDRGAAARLSHISPRGNREAWLSLILLVGLLAAPGLLSGAGQSKKLATDPGVLRVLALVEKILAREEGGAPAGSDKVRVEESDLNCYIAYLIELEKEPVMRELKLKLFDGNRVEGMILVDLRGYRLPRVLKPQMRFYFQADLETREGLGRLRLRKLFLEEQEIPATVLDLVIAVAALASGDKAGGIGDWYEIPYGISEIRTYKGKADFIY